MMRKGPGSGADVVILDLEDAVAPDRKAEAREAVAEVLSDPEFDPDCEVCVRVNADPTVADEDARVALSGNPVDSVMLPKAESAEDAETLAEILVERGVDAPLLAICESAAGVLHAEAIAAADPVDALAFGAEDFSADVGATRLFGHSFGGLVALNAATRPTVDLETLVLYEPAVLVGEHRGDEIGAEMGALLEAGDREGALRLAFTQVGIEDVEALPHWPEVLDLAEVTQREFAAVDDYELPETLAVEAETLVLTGERSPTFLQDGAREVHDRLPNAGLVEIEGVGHAGVENPSAVAEPVLEFLA